MLNYSFNKLKLNIEFRQRPDKRAMFEVNMGIVDAEFARINDIKNYYDSIILVPEPMLTVNLVAFAVDETKDF